MMGMARKYTKMIKFFLGVAIIVFFSFCGYLFAKKYRKRKHFFMQLYDFNDRFLNEISYYRRPIVEFIVKYSFKGEFNLYIESFINNIQNISVCFDELENEEFYFLKKEEKSILVDYFSMLGKGDSSSQKGYFSSVKDDLRQRKIETDAEYKKYGDLYIKLGFLCGLLVLILIV